MGKVPAALRAHQFKKGSPKAKAAGRKKPGSSRKGVGSKMPPDLLARFQGKAKGGAKKKGKKK